MWSNAVRRNWCKVTLILLACLLLTSCGVITTVRNRLLERTQPTAEPPPVPTPAPIVSRQPVESSAPPILERELDETPYSLVDNRLYIRMPLGTEDDPRQPGIMSAEASNHAETRLVLEGNGQQLILYAQEAFYYTDDLEGNAERLLRERYGQTFEYTAQAPKRSADGFTVIRYSPKAIDTSADAALIQGALVGMADGTFLTVGVYVTPETAKDMNLCVKRAEDILNTLQPGTRTINTEPREARLGLNSITIQLDAGYEIVQDEGADFSVFYLMKFVNLDEPAPNIGIYIGMYPTWTFENRGMDESQMTKTKDTILNKKVEWLSYGPTENWKYCSAETYLYLNKSLIMHIFIDAEDEAEMLKIQKMIHTLKIR